MTIDTATGARGISILVVEDEPVVRMLVVDHLEELGFDVTEAGDASEALALLEGGGRYDVMLTDVGLPGMNGRDLADRVRLALPDIKILFATGYSASGGAELGLPAPGMELVTKPFDTDELARRIDIMLAG